MSARFSRIATLLVVLSLFQRPICADEDPLKAADAAWAAGDQPRALQLYDAALSRDPQNMHALIRSAMLLSWTRRYDEAVARYDRALKVTPDDPTVILERAKVLSWSRRYSEASAGFHKMIKIDPTNHEARIGLARTLSWSGNQLAARKEYTALVDLNPNDSDALVGVAQTYAWSGDQTTAHGWYDRALKADPTHRGALIGLAYVDLAMANRSAADRRASDLARRFPNDGDVRELRSAVRRAMTPSVEASYEALKDSDHNDLDTSRLRLVIPLPERADLAASVARYEMRSRRSEGSVSTAHLQLILRPAPLHRFTFRGGIDRSENSLGKKKNENIGGVSWAIGDEAKLLAILSADRETFKYSVPILDNRIVVDSYTARLISITRRVHFEAGGGVGEFSDDNRRNNGDALLLFRFPPKNGVRFEAGYGYRYLNFEKTLNHGYFEPNDYNGHTLQLRLGGPFGSTRGYFALAAEGGYQSFSFRGVKTKNDKFAGETATIGIPLGSVLTLELSANKSESAIAAASGFSSKQLTARLRFQR